MTTSQIAEVTPEAWAKASKLRSAAGDAA